MNLINAIKSLEELEAYRDHVGRVRTKDNQPLRLGKLNNHTARLLGVADWNTALAMFTKPEVSDAMMIKAEFETDDGTHKAKFDAEPYFRNLRDNWSDLFDGYIENIFAEWGTGSYVTDDVAKTLAESHEFAALRRSRMSEYAGLIAANQHLDFAEDSGFEVTIDLLDLAAWVRKEAPHLSHLADDIE